MRSPTSSGPLAAVAIAETRRFNASRSVNVPRGSMPTARWSSPSRPQRAFAMVRSSLTRGTSAGSMSNDIATTGCAKSSTTSSTRKRPSSNCSSCWPTVAIGFVTPSERSAICTGMSGTPAAGFPANTDCTSGAKRSTSFVSTTTSRGANTADPSRCRSLKR